MKARSFLALLAAMTLAAPARVLAAEPLPTEAAMADAEARFREGVARSRAGDMEGARRAFVQAYAVLRTDGIMFNLALSELKTGRPVEALVHFRAYAKHTGKADEVTSHVEEAMKQTGHLRLAGPDGAQVVVDGEVQLEDLPLRLPIDVLPGKHRIEVRSQGKGASREVSVAAGETKDLYLDVSGGGAMSAGAAPSEADVLLRAANAGPPARGEDHAGVPGRPWRPSAGQWIGAGALGVMGAGAAVASIVFSSSADQSARDAKSLRDMGTSGACAAATPPAYCATLNSAVRAQNSAHDYSTVAAITSPVLLLSAFVVLTPWRFFGGNAPAADDTPIALRPNVGPARAALDLRVRF